MRKILVTGSSRGIGREIAKSFLSDPFNFVIFHGSSKSINLEDLFSDLNPEERKRTSYIGIDLSNIEEVKNIKFPIGNKYRINKTKTLI